ncbi:DUF6695 family protein [Dokdonia sinensis]|uniref:DUF6695 family protein n=1 Tax=Dokdonia sinensis TaxID=2479847 RepID=UPI00191BDDBB|nr:DUF6695 family protein [Dokdonia sinensis]
MNHTGKIIVLAFPDTFVKMSDELMCKILPLVGLGTRTHIKAGHAALVLIENETGNAQYFDFGRYITPPGKGRVRGAITDVELEIPFKAKIKNKKLENLDDFLIWLDAHPEKTHGSGRLVASLCESINYEKAIKYILDLQSQGSIPYRAFGKEGSNCSRLVTETILASTDEKAIIKRLKWNKKFTPSTVGNVEKSASDVVFEVLNGKVSIFNSTALRENLTNYFDKKVNMPRHNDSHLKSLPKEAQLLTGIGSSAYFYLEPLSETSAAIRRYTEEGLLDFEGITTIPKGFELSKTYTFVYDSNCAFCTIEQGGKNFCFKLERKEDKKSSSSQMSHSA